MEATVGNTFDRLYISLPGCRTYTFKLCLYIYDSDGKQHKKTEVNRRNTFYLLFTAKSHVKSTSTGSEASAYYMPSEFRNERENSLITIVTG